MKPIIKSMIVLLIAGFAGCSTSRITSTWKAPNVQAQSFKRIMVLGLINEPDRTVREKMERHLVGDLKDIGYDAICSCEEFGPKSFENLSEKEAIARLKNSGVDAILTVVLLDKTKERYYVPERVYYSPYTIYHRRFWGYYTTIYDRVYAPGYYETNTQYFWESNLYDLTKDGQELIYSVQTRSFDPESGSTLAHEYGKLIVNDMVANNVLDRQPAAKAGF